MVLRCPYCSRRSQHLRSDFVGEWVVCPICEVPFAWREVPPTNPSSGTANDQANNNGKPRSRKRTGSTRNGR